MGKLCHADFEQAVDLKAILYGLEIKLRNKGLTPQDMDSILNTLYRYQDDFPFVSFLYVESTTDAIDRKRITTNKAGRPKEVPIGPNVPPHVHIAIIGDKENSAWKYKEIVKEAINKRFKMRIVKDQSKGKNEWAINYINFCFRQKDTYIQSGPFKFTFYKRYPSFGDFDES